MICVRSILLPFELMSYCCLSFSRYIFTNSAYYFSFLHQFVIKIWNGTKYNFRQSPRALYHVPNWNPRFSSFCVFLETRSWSKREKRFQRKTCTVFSRFNFQDFIFITNGFCNDTWSYVQGSIGQDGGRGADGRTGFCVSIDLRYYSQSSILLNFGLMSLWSPVRPNIFRGCMLKKKEKAVNNETVTNGQRWWYA